MAEITAVSGAKNATNTEPVIYSGTVTGTSVDPTSSGRTNEAKDTFIPTLQKDDTEIDYTGRLKTKSQIDSQKNQADQSDNTKKSAKSKENNTAGTKELSDSEKKAVDELKKIDAKVKTHEAAHQAAGGSLARGKSFTYVSGPDGVQYAVAGEVQIDMSAVPDDPDATISKMQQVRRAALAPSDPSAQDRSVAQSAQAIEIQAQTQKTQEASANTNETGTAPGTDNPGSLAADVSSNTSDNAVNKEAETQTQSTTETEKAVKAYQDIGNYTRNKSEMIDIINDIYGIYSLQSSKPKKIKIEQATAGLT